MRNPLLLLNKNQIFRFSIFKSTFSQIFNIGFIVFILLIKYTLGCAVVAMSESHPYRKPHPVNHVTAFISVFALLLLALPSVASQLRQPALSAQEVFPKAASTGRLQRYSHLPVDSHASYEIFLHTCFLSFLLVFSASFFFFHSTSFLKTFISINSTQSINDFYLVIPTLCLHFSHQTPQPKSLTADQYRRLEYFIVNDHGLVMTGKRLKVARRQLTKI